MPTANLASEPSARIARPPIIAGIPVTAHAALNEQFRNLAHFVATRNDVLAITSSSPQSLERCCPGGMAVMREAGIQFTHSLPIRPAAGIVYDASALWMDAARFGKPRSARYVAGAIDRLTHGAQAGAISIVLFRPASPHVRDDVVRHWLALHTESSVIDTRSAVDQAVESIVSAIAANHRRPRIVRLFDTYAEFTAVDSSADVLHVLTSTQRGYELEPSGPSVLTSTLNLFSRYYAGSATVYVCNVGLAGPVISAFDLDAARQAAETIARVDYPLTIGIHSNSEVA